MDRGGEKGGKITPFKSRGEKLRREASLSEERKKRRSRKE